MTSQGAKGGFQNESDVIQSFNDMNQESFVWLHHMGVDPNQVGKVIAKKGSPGTKPDVLVSVFDKNGKKLLETKISVKLTSNAKRGFNQLDRGDVTNRYQKLWASISKDTETGLKLFTGILPPISASRDGRRMFLDELPPALLLSIKNFFESNKIEVVSDLLAGREPDKAKFLLCVSASDATSRVLPMEQAVGHYSSGPVVLTPRGSLQIGRITMQRKGGDSGAESAKNLQFKFDPNEVFSI
jgi:hypothetical protein